MSVDDLPAQMIALKLNVHGLKAINSDLKANHIISMLLKMFADK